MATLGDKAVGSIVKINVNGTATDFIIVHQGNPDTSMYGSSCNGTWVMMKDCYEQRAWDSSNNYYKDSDIHAYLNDTFLNYFDNNIKSAIKQVRIPHQNGTGSGGNIESGSGSYGLSCKIFLLSGYELGFTQTEYGKETLPIDGARLSYFFSYTVTEREKKRIANYNGSAALWWLRSPLTNNTDHVWCVLANGEYLDCNYNSTYGVRPAFILSSDTIVADDGTVGNSTPTISGSNSSGSNLGEISAPFNFTYTVRDADNDTVTVKEYLDNVLQRSYTASLGATNTFRTTSDAALFQKILNGSHTIKVIATDSAGASSSAYTITFNKQVKTATITLTTPLPADDVIKAAVVTVTGNIPQDAMLEVLATNNALDENPVWEDMTQDYLKKINHLFSNKTAANGFAFNFKVTMTRGASGTQGYISSIGGAFE